MQREITVGTVRSSTTPGGSVRWVVRDTEGNEYSTFREAIGSGLADMEGKRARIEFHEQQRGQYTNIYLDSIEPVEPAGSAGAECAEADPEEAAWQTAVAAAPWLVGEPKAAVQPKKLYDKLKPFEEYVARDIEEHQRARSSDEHDEAG